MMPVGNAGVYLIERDSTDPLASFNCVKPLAVFGALQFLNKGW